MSWPPAISRRTLSRVPRHLRADCRQVAWQAWCEGRNPSTAVRNFLISHRRKARRQRPFSELVDVPTRVAAEMGDDLQAFRAA